MSNKKVPNYDGKMPSRFPREFGDKLGNLPKTPLAFELFQVAFLHAEEQKRYDEMIKGFTVPSDEAGIFNTVLNAYTVKDKDASIYFEVRPEVNPARAEGRALMYKAQKCLETMGFFGELKEEAGVIKNVPDASSRFIADKARFYAVIQHEGMRDKLAAIGRNI